MWIASTYFTDCIEVAPLLIIDAPDSACGKSRLLEIVGWMCCRPVSAANSSMAYVFRIIEMCHPTLLVDEADTFMNGSTELAGIINAGYTKANAFVGRTVGDDHEPKLFDVWGSKVLAGIQLETKLARSTLSRAIHIKMRRRMQDEVVQRSRKGDKAVFATLAAKLTRFAQDNAGQVEAADPTLPDDLSDREQDNWHPLVAVAQCAGEEWAKLAVETALSLAAETEQVESIGTTLLKDIRDIVENYKAEKVDKLTGNPTDRICSSDLLSVLNHDDEKTWSTYNRGNEFSAHQLAKYLKPYGIKSRDLKFDKQTKKGFQFSDFEDAFSRYLPPN